MHLVAIPVSVEAMPSCGLNAVILMQTLTIGANYIFSLG